MLAGTGAMLLIASERAGAQENGASDSTRPVPLMLTALDASERGGPRQPGQLAQPEQLAQRGQYRT